MTDIIYSATLFVSLLASAGATVLLVRGKRSAARKGRRYSRAALLAGTAFVLGIVSALVHWLAGHGAASPGPMTLPAYGTHHPVSVIALVWALGLLAFSLPGENTDR